MIKINNLSFSYGKKQIYKNFSLTIPAGQCCLITGINGMGKTTLLRLLAGALRKDSGKIEYPSILNPKKEVALISDKLSLFENIRVKEMIALHKNIYKLKNDELKLEIINKMNIDKNVIVSSLSLGQRTMLLLDLMLATNPKVMLIDEVLPALDAYVREMFLETLTKQREKNNMTIVTVNLNFHDIEDFAERIVLLKNGEIFIDETIIEIKNKVRLFKGDKPPDNQKILFKRNKEKIIEYYIYPCTNFDEKLEELTLTEIVSAFIGTSYV